MRIARRLVLAALLVLVALGLFAGWQAYQLKQDLSAAESDVDRLDAALRGDDLTARNQAAKDLTDHAAAAADRTDGFVWGLVEHTPMYGDDAQAVSAISRSLDTLAQGAVQPLLATVDSMDGLTGGGRIDVEKLEALKEPVQTARKSAVEARAEVEDLDSDDYVGAVGTRVDEYIDRLDDLVGGLGSGERALKVLPGVLGADGPRDYLLVFQNNAEIRATGGIPGSWAQIHTDEGRMQIVKQGSSSSFQDVEDRPVPITDEEEIVYSELLGKFWQDATFTPNWTRASELMTARWENLYPPTKLDGVLSLDPVAMSYLLNGTGPVSVADITLEPGNVVDMLLSAPYQRFDAKGQDEFFAEAARAIFDAVTGDLAAPLELVKGLDRAAGERRFLVNLLDPSAAKLLEGAGITGDLPIDDGNSPRIVVALNDGTASKMSYYLRYDATATSQDCAADGTQVLNGSASLSQSITAEDAKGLPEVVTGPGDIGIPLGFQLVVLRLYSPTGGTIDEVTVAGARVDVKSSPLDGRAVVTLVAQLSGPRPVPVTWTMHSGPGQASDGHVQVTPGIEAGSEDSAIKTSC